ncbi:hypothetical protein CBDKU1_39120 [Clostridium butyricum DKU-01]|nr:hypothetical protein CBDKU1_39120 [Clostridium butyricum DKU-01]
MSRGCPFNCDFCTTPNYYKGNLRFRDPNDVVEEMKFLNKNYDVDKFFFADDLFFYGSKESIKRVSKLADLIEQNTLNISFRGECRADVMLDNLDIVKKLYKAGMKYVFVGLESSVSKDLDNYNKRISTADVANLPKLLNEIGISLVPGFIIFNKYSELNDIRLNLLFLRNNDLMYRITMISRTCLGYPGSDMYKEMKLKKDYDISRSSTNILYPNFVSEKVRTLSVAMGYIEIMFLTLDSKMLQLKIYKYDEIKIRRKDREININVEEADRIFDKLQDIYVQTFSAAIDIAEQEEFEVGYNKIIDLFKEIYSKAEEMISSFEKVLS